MAATPPLSMGDIDLMLVSLAGGALKGHRMWGELFWKELEQLGLAIVQYTLEAEAQHGRGRPNPKLRAIWNELELSTSQNPIARDWARRMAEAINEEPTPDNPGDTSHLNCLEARRISAGYAICEPCNTGHPERCVYMHHRGSMAGDAEYDSWKVLPARTQYVHHLEKALEGWQAECDLERRHVAALQEELMLRSQHQAGDVWFWQGDGTDHPESMSNSMAVVMRVPQLRQLLVAKDLVRYLVPVHPEDGADWDSLYQGNDAPWPCTDGYEWRRVLIPHPAGIKAPDAASVAAADLENERGG